MIFRKLLTLSFLVVFCVFAIAGQDGIEFYSDSAAFKSAVNDANVVDFEGIAPNSGFKQFKSEGSLRHAGSEFRPGGGAKFGPGVITIAGPWYQAGPAYETTSGAKLIWSPPNQPDNAYLDISLPSGVTAVGLDLWAAQPYESPIEVVVTTADGKSRSETIHTPQRPIGAFVGFIAASPISAIRLTPAKGQTGLIVDNFTTGRGNITESAAKTRPSENTTAAVSESTSSTPRPNEIPRAAIDHTSVPRKETSQPIPQSGEGRIAYVRGSTEIRLIAPDGSGDRRLWTHPDLNEELGIFDMAWRPNSNELTFSSAHEATASLYLADLYSIKSDGTGLRRLTNPPAHNDSGKYPKGSVTVTVANYQASSVTMGNFIIYVAGADEPQAVVLPAGAAKTIVFKSVADFGKHAQPVVAMNGKYRWFIPGVDVLAGRNVTAPSFAITGTGFDMFGALRPVWRSDGSRVSYRSGLCVVSSVSASPADGEYSFNPLFGGKNPGGTCTWDWGPTPATANQVIYSENSSGGSNIYQMTEGGTHPGTKLVQFSDIDYQLLFDLRWLPDGSGFLYSTLNLFRDSSNIYRFDFSTRRAAQITKLDKDFARAFSISPDGRSVVFERCPTADEEKGCDLWIAGTDGSRPHQLVKNGLRPAWGK